MRSSLMLPFAAAFLFFCLPANSDEDLSVQDLLGQSVFEDCGLDRLEPEELARLSLYLAPPELRSFEIDGAMAYMAKEGWEPITLYPGLKVEPEQSFSEVRHLAFTRNGELILESRFSSDPILPPGYYLAKVGSLWVDVMDFDGREQRLYVE